MTLEEIGCLVATRLMNETPIGRRLSDKELAEFADAVIEALEQIGDNWPKKQPETQEVKHE